MTMTITGAEASSQIEQAKQQALDNARRNAALNALTSVYGPVGGDPEVWMKGSQAKAAADQVPYAGPTAAAGLQKQQLENADTQRQQQQMAVYRAAGMLKQSAAPDGSVDPDAFDKLIAPNAQLLGLDPQQLPQMKALLTAPGGTQHLDDIQQSMLGPAKVTGGEQFGTINGQTVSLAHDQYGRPIVQNLGNILPTAVQNANTKANNSIIGPDGQVNQAYVGAKAQIAAATAKAGVTLTDQGLDLATQYFLKTGEMPNLGMGSGATKAAIINKAAEGGATGDTVAGAKQDYKSAQAYETDLAKSSPTSAGGIARSAGAVFQHIDTLDQMIEGLQNGNIRYANAAAQKFKAETGKPAPVTFDAQKTLVGDELTRYLIARGGTSKDREEMQAGLAKANSPPQLRAVIKTWRDDIGAQLYSQYSQAKGFGKEKQFLGVLTPEARFILTGVGEPSLPGSVAGRPTGNQPQQPNGGWSIKLKQ